MGLGVRGNGGMNSDEQGRSFQLSSSVCIVRDAFLGSVARNTERGVPLILNQFSH